MAKMPGVETLIDNLAVVKASFEKLGSQRVMIGIPTDHDPRTPEQGETKTLGNAEIGYIMETGAPEAGIPARPWLVPGVKEAQPDVLKYMAAAGRVALSAAPGSDDKVDQYMNSAGLEAVNKVRAYLQDSSHFQPLAAATLASRRARGRSGVKPLIDTGQLRNNVTYVIRKGKT